MIMSDAPPKSAAAHRSRAPSIRMPPVSEPLREAEEDHGDHEQARPAHEQRPLVPTARINHLQRDVGGQGPHRGEERIRHLNQIAAHHDDRHGLPERPAELQYASRDNRGSMTPRYRRPSTGGA